MVDPGLQLLLRHIAIPVGVNLVHDNTVHRTGEGRGGEKGGRVAQESSVGTVLEFLSPPSHLYILYMYHSTLTLNPLMAYHSPFIHHSYLSLTLTHHSTSPLTARSLLTAPHPSQHKSVLTPHSTLHSSRHTSPLIPHSSLLTAPLFPHAALLTPYRTPHPSFLTPYRTPHPSPLTPHPSLLRASCGDSLSNLLASSFPRKASWSNCGECSPARCSATVSSRSARQSGSSTRTTAHLPVPNTRSPVGPAATREHTRVHVTPRMTAVAFIVTVRPLVPVRVLARCVLAPSLQLQHTF